MSKCNLKQPRLGAEARFARPGFRLPAGPATFLPMGLSSGVVIAMFCVFFPTVLAQGCLESQAPAPTTETNSRQAILGSVAQDLELEKLLLSELGKSPSPAWFAAVYDTGKPIRMAAVGKRKYKEDATVDCQDLVHLGSCTKAMTATLAGIFVDAGQLQWDSTIQQVLPRLSKKIHPGYRGVTLEQLLSHRSGMPANAKNWWLNNETKPIGEIRFDVAVDSLQKAPAAAPGKKYIYSNLGYMVVGMMIAERGGKSWESLITEKLFLPLEMNSAGFGPLPSADEKVRQKSVSRKSDGDVSQAWGHIFSKKPMPLQHDNAPALGPAGRVHLTMADWMKFCRLQLTGNEKIIRNPTLTRLQNPTMGNYGGGWIVGRNGKRLGHSGSNTMWFATAEIDKQKGRIVLVICNIAEPKSEKANMKLVRTLMKE